MAAPSSIALAVVSQFEPGSARRAAAALLAPLAPRGLPLSEILSRALSLDLFTPRPPPLGVAADVAAWAEMSEALMSDESFVVLSPGVFTLRALAPHGAKAPAPQPPVAPPTPVASLSDGELAARLAASLALRQAAEKMLSTPQFHRAAREAREAGDATVLAQHLATLRPDNALALCPEVYLALANRDYPGAEVEALWQHHYAAAAKLGALLAERTARVEAEKRAVAAEAREERMMQRAVAMVQRAGLDPYELLFGRGEGEEEPAPAALDDHGVKELLRGAEQAAEAPPPEDDDDAAGDAPASEPAGDGADAPPLCGDADAPSEPRAEAKPDEPATAASADEELDAQPLAAPRGIGEVAHDAPTAAADGPAGEDAHQHDTSPLPPPQTGADAEAEAEAEEGVRKRAASEAAADEPSAKAARSDAASDEPRAEAGAGAGVADAAPGAHALEDGSSELDEVDDELDGELAEPADVDDEPAEPEEIDVEPAEPIEVDDEPEDPAEEDDEPVEPAEVDDDPAEPADVDDEPADVDDEPAHAAELDDEAAEPAGLDDELDEEADMPSEPSAPDELAELNFAEPAATAAAEDGIDVQSPAAAPPPEEDFSTPRGDLSSGGDDSVDAADAAATTAVPAGAATSGSCSADAERSGATAQFNRWKLSDGAGDTAAQPQSFVQVPYEATAAAVSAPSPPPPVERVCLCAAVLSECEARGDALVRCTGCERRFHPACCGYPATLTAAEAAMMRPPFACYDHLVFFRPDGAAPLPVPPGEGAEPASPDAAETAPPLAPPSDGAV